MNPDIQKKLCDLARHVGTKLKFAEGMPVAFYGCQLAHAPIAVINSNLPQSELIFTILHEIAHYELHCKRSVPQPIPAIFNRPYESEMVGEIAYRTKRVLKRKYNQEWQANLWALCAFTQIGCPDDLKEFLQRHPKQTALFPVVVFVIWKCRVTTFCKKLLRISFPIIKRN